MVYFKIIVYLCKCIRLTPKPITSLEAIVLKDLNQYCR